jgi:hypothetical protein
VTEKVPLSRHWKVQLGKSKAMILAAAGALSVTAAASVTAATWSPETPSHATSAASTAPVPELPVADVLTQPPTTPAAPPQAPAAAQAQAKAPAAAQAKAQEQARAQAQAQAQAKAQEQPTEVVTLAFRATPQQIAKAMLRSFGWSRAQFSCLGPLWAHESGWSVTAYNPWSGAYGIPQALPGVKMASAGPAWQTNAATQIRWGLRYIRGIYGSPCGALAHEQATGWY